MLGMCQASNAFLRSSNRMAGTSPAMQPVTTCAKGAVEAGPGATPWSRERWWRDEAHRPLSRLLLSGGEDVRGTEALEVVADDEW
jgi:hypothetical protein